MNFLFLSCLKASELIEKKIDHKLNTKEKVQLFMHTKMCDACSSYQKQSNQLEITLRKHITTEHSKDKKTKQGLSPDFKKAIVHKIEKN